MKILQISASYKPAYIYGGPIMSVSMLAEQLSKLEAEVTVFTTTANGLNELPVNTNQPVFIDGVTVIYFKRITKDHTHLSPALLKNVWQKARDYDVVHIHAWWNLVSMLSCLIAVMRNVKVVVSPRGTLSNYSFNNKNNGIKGLIHTFLTKPLLKKCDIHTTSDNEYSAVKSIIQAKHIFNIPNFIRLNVNKQYAVVPSIDHIKLIFLSRIEEKKGLDILFDALKDVQIPYRLTIAGDGNSDYIKSLKAIAVNNNIDAHIDWIGFQSDNKFDLLHEHDLLVLPSHDENFGNVVIESLSVGTAVLISEQVGLADYVVTNNLGWICQTNASSVSAAISTINSRFDELQRIRKEAPAIILEDFNYNNMAVKYINMYNQIITK
ncbi:Glycosyltransferase involved in cell wall bisynthesis [Mucilaginibacter mallensis]|uniref:Glycosyltransferase involved in cell wall bisynthesis n=1 Tax=Mucilaginibacter mallensis TaxID=652787 RepID=A0A1H2B599_MUCMA|nr:glycosyltransferase [Mucilaginibacter mallensis]SDT53247.1 Glycosyltransferase involved in cell wall bisynthesis [Mucilaginibacter mallensis]